MLPSISSLFLLDCSLCMISSPFWSLSFGALYSPDLKEKIWIYHNLGTCCLIDCHFGNDAISWWNVLKKDSLIVINIDISKQWWNCWKQDWPNLPNCSAMLQGQNLKPFSWAPYLLQMECQDLRIWVQLFFLVSLQITNYLINHFSLFWNININYN